MQIISQLPTNQNLSGFMVWLLPGFVLPILMTLAAVIAKRDRSLNIRNMFDVALLIVSVGLIGSLVSTAASAVITGARIVMDGYPPYFILYTGIPAAVSVIALIIILVILRRKKQW